VRSIDQISARFAATRQLCAERDSAANDIHNIRDGKIADVFPSMFNTYFPAPIIQNFIDTAARDVAESLAPLPAFNCVSASMTSDAARKKAEKRTMGANYYVESNEVDRLMFTAADHFASYGFVAAIVEPNFVEKQPRIRFANSRGSYYELDMAGATIWFATLYTKTVRELCYKYPELASQIVGKDRNYESEALLELVDYQDADVRCLFIPQRADLILNAAPNPLKVCCVAIAERAGVTDRPRGQYDDVMWIQVMRNRFAMMAAQAAEQAVEAPLAVPQDVQDISFGGMQVIRSNNPEKIRKVAQDLPQAAFAEGQLLDEEMKAGARYPGVRTGNLDASIVTGQGVKALEGGYDSQIRSGQALFAVMFRKVIKFCFMMDEKLWGDTQRDITGQKDGIAYSLNWTPSRDIAGDYLCNVEYGFAAGLDPNRAVVLLLQVLGAGLVSQDFTRRQLPFPVNAVQEQQKIEVEGLRQSLIQAMAGYAQSIPILVQNGMDPSKALQQVAEVIQGRMKGKPLEDVVEDAFAPEPQVPTDPNASGNPMSTTGGQPPGMGAPDGMQSNGLPMGVAAGQATMGPGGSPDLMTLLSSLNGGGAPDMSASVKRRVPV